MYEDKIICGDCIEILRNIPRDSIDLIFADPPFNLSKNYGEKVNDDLLFSDYMEWVKEWLTECYAILKSTGSIYVMNIQENIWIFQKILYDLGMIFRNTIVWKNSSMPIKNRYCINYQPIIYYVKSKNYTFNHKAENHISSAAMPWNRVNKGNLMIDQWNDIPFISGGCMASKEAILLKGSSHKAHPAQMPLKLAERVIKFSSNEGDIVLDPFVGSGTTAVAAKMLDRHFIGIEISEDFCNIARDRLISSNIGGYVYDSANENVLRQLFFDLEG